MPRKKHQERPRKGRSFFRSRDPAFLEACREPLPPPLAATVAVAFEFAFVAIAFQAISLSLACMALVSNFILRATFARGICRILMSYGRKLGGAVPSNRRYTR
jgi:hypothetical protein